jgi:hypothetical protein
VGKEHNEKAKAALLAHLQTRPVRQRPIGRWDRDELYD